MKMRIRKKEARSEQSRKKTQQQQQWEEERLGRRQNTKKMTMDVMVLLKYHFPFEPGYCVIRRRIVVVVVVFCHILPIYPSVYTLLLYLVVRFSASTSLIFASLTLFRFCGCRRLFSSTMCSTTNNLNTHTRSIPSSSSCLALHFCAALVR